MDKKTKDLLAEIKLRVEINKGEDILNKPADAIAILQRNGLLWRYALNGSTYEIRWSDQHPPILYPETSICELACAHIINELKPKVAPKQEAE